MNDVEIFEQEIFDSNNNFKGKVAILRGGLNKPNPISYMNEVVARYVENGSYTQYVDINLDNPCTRDIFSAINEVEFKELTNQRLRR